MWTYGDPMDDFGAYSSSLRTVILPSVLYLCVVKMNLYQLARFSTLVGAYLREYFAEG